MNGGGDICAALRNHIHIQRIKRFPKGVVIERDRTLQKRAAGKGNQTNAIAVELRDEIRDREFRTREPIRLHILREHALRGVDREKKFESFAMRLLKFKTGLRTSERDENERHAEYEKDALHQSA